MSDPQVIIVIPVFNDWQALALLLPRLRDIPGVRVLVVDDGSTIPLPDPFPLPPGLEVELVELVANQGHQRALAVGLAEACRRDGWRALVIMDGDGEDDPGDIPRLLAALPGHTLVMALRDKRSEGAAFRLGYHLYRLLFRLLTGHAVPFGNFCAMTRAGAERLIYMPNLWISLPATALRSRLPWRGVATQRGRRLDGRSRMGFVNLVLHGLSAVTVFADTALARLSLFLTGLSLTGVLIVVAIRLFTNLAIPGWASTMVGFLSLFLLLSLLGLLAASLLTLLERGRFPMLPALHAAMFIKGVRWLNGD